MKVRLTTENIGFSYSAKTDETVFKDIGLSVNAGEIFCLLGPNGTGKSTLLKCLCGLLRPQWGKVLLDGKNIAAQDRNRVARKMGYVPQSHSPVFPFLVEDMVVMGRAPHLSLLGAPSEKDYELARKALESVGIGHLAPRPCTGLSGGEWQLTLIARALAQAPEILLLDEPTSHLDLGNQMKILSVIRQLADTGLTILMATHFPDHAFLAASCAAILDGGRITAFGPPDNVLTEPILEKTYGTKVRILTIEEAGQRKICLPELVG